MTGPWVHTWVCAPQLTEPADLPPAPFTGGGLALAGATLRQTVRLSLGGRQLRLRFSNAFGREPLAITTASVALPLNGQAGTGAIRARTSRAVTFHGRPGVVVPAGAQVVSDPLPYPVAAQANLTVTTYLTDGVPDTGLTSHPGSRTSSHLLAGNHVDAVELPGAAVVEHWYLLTGVEVRATRDAVAAVVLGDSLTDGRGTTTNLNDRWPDRLLSRLQRHRDTARVAILNQGAGGNRMLNDGIGPSMLARLDRDVLALGRVGWLVVLGGINDIGTAAATAPAQKAVADELTAGYDQLVTRVHARGIQAYGGTLLPFGGNDTYDDPDGLREHTRQAVNDWLRGAGRFDEVVDFDRAVRDPQRPNRLLPAFDCGDHLHLNPAGYQALADAVPARLFARDAVTS